MSQQQDHPMSLFFDAAEQRCEYPHNHKQVEPRYHPAPRGDVWRDVGEVCAPDVQETSDVAAFIAAHDLRKVVDGMRSRALDIFRDHGALYLELNNDILWLRLESFEKARDVKDQDKEFSEWFVSHYSPEITARVQLIIDFIKR